MKPTVTLAALDMAGTTVADDGVVVRAFEAALAATGTGTGDDRLGGSTGEFVHRTMGRSKIEVFTELFDGDRSRAEAATAAFEADYDRSIDRGEITEVPGAGDLFASLRDAGIKVCLTTGFAPVTRDHLLDALGWRDAVDLALSPVDAGRGRPWPDMVLVAVLRLGIDDVRQVAVAGDTASDLMAGTRAGASVVAGVLTGAHSRAELEQAPHTHILGSVVDLPAVWA